MQRGVQDHHEKTVVTFQDDRWVKRETTVLGREKELWVAGGGGDNQIIQGTANSEHTCFVLRDLLR